MKLLCIANPGAYELAITDVPLSYQYLAAHPDTQLFHTDTSAMMEAGHSIMAVRIQPGFTADEFLQITARAATPMPPSAFDIAFCRTLKPFPSGYLAALSGWSQRTQFVNHPDGITRQLDVGFLLEAASDFTPPALVTRQPDVAHRFLKDHGTVVIKRSNSCGGRGVYKVSTKSQGKYTTDNVIEKSRYFDCFSDCFQHITQNCSDSVLVMRYLHRVTEGDKRIVVMDGEIFGAYLRRSKEGHWIQNVSFGSSCEGVSVSEEDRAIVAATAPYYQSVGIRLLGYDLLRDDDGSWKVSEINAGNIGGLFRLESMGITGATARFVKKLQATKRHRCAA